MHHIQYRRPSGLFRCIALVTLLASCSRGQTDRRHREPDFQSQELGTQKISSCAEVPVDTAKWARAVTRDSYVSLLLPAWTSVDTSTRYQVWSLEARREANATTVAYRRIADRDRVSTLHANLDSSQTVSWCATQSDHGMQSFVHFARASTHLGGQAIVEIFTRVGRADTLAQFIVGAADSTKNDEYLQIARSIRRIAPR